MVYVKHLSNVATCIHQQANLQWSSAEPVDVNQELTELKGFILKDTDFLCIIISIVLDWRQAAVISVSLT